MSENMHEKIETIVNDEEVMEKTPIEIWAEREIEMACDKNPENAYTRLCYESAYRAFQSLVKDSYSGCSVTITKNVLNRLIDLKPLTPIDNREEDWNEVYIDEQEGITAYQNERCSGLFKYVYKCGKIRYSDIDRVVAYNIDNPTIGWYNGLISRIINEMYPIIFPYYPSTTPIKVYIRECLADPKNGAHDTIEIIKAIFPNGDVKQIDRYFGEKDDDMVEINLEEYHDRLNPVIKIKKTKVIDKYGE